jgi:hypothetical protein
MSDERMSHSRARKLNVVALDGLLTDCDGAS